MSVLKLKRFSFNTLTNIELTKVLDRSAIPSVETLTLGASSDTEYHVQLLDIWEVHESVLTSCSICGDKLSRNSVAVGILTASKEDSNTFTKICRSYTMLSEKTETHCSIYAFGFCTKHNIDVKSFIQEIKCNKLKLIPEIIQLS